MALDLDDAIDEALELLHLRAGDAQRGARQPVRRPAGGSGAVALRDADVEQRGGDGR
jgi:hypothetical protein